MSTERHMMADDSLATQLVLESAVDQMTRPQRLTLDHAPKLRIAQPALIDQLAEAKESSTSRGGAVTSSPYTAPVALDVLDLLTEIGHVTLLALRSAGDRRSWSDDALGDQLRAWAAQAGRWRATDQGYLAYAAHAAQRWVTRAREILTPEPPTFEVQPQPCPTCGEKTVFVWSAEHRERVQRAALFFDKDRTSVRCRVDWCGAEWGPSDFEALHRALDAGETAS